MIVLPMRRPVSWQQLAILALAGGLLLASWVLSPSLVVAGSLGVAALLLTLRYPVAGFMLLAFAVPWGSALPSGLGSSLLGPTDMLIAAVGAAWLVRAAQERSFGWDRAPLIPYIGLFLAAILISLSQATDLAASGRELIKWTELAVVYMAASHFITNPRHVRMVVGAVVAGGVSEAFLGFDQSFLHIGPAAFAGRLFYRAYGTFDQPNPYAGYLNITLAVALGFALLSGTGVAGRSPRTGAHRLSTEQRWYWAAAVLMALAVLLSGSRGALLAGIVAGAFMLGYASRSMRRFVWLGVLALGVFALLASYGMVPTSLSDQALNAVGLGNVSFTSVNDANFSAVERAAHWLAGVRMFAAHPVFGVGIGNYAAAYPAFHPRGWYASLDHAHNYFINIAAEAGILGLAAYVLLLGSALWYCCLSMRQAHVRVYRAAGLGVTGALIATSFHNLFDVLYVHGIVPLLGLLLAVASVAFSDRKTPAEVTIPGVLPPREA